VTISRTSVLPGSSPFVIPSEPNSFLEITVSTGGGRQQRLDLVIQIPSDFHLLVTRSVDQGSARSIPIKVRPRFDVVVLKCNGLGRVSKAGRGVVAMEMSLGRLQCRPHDGRSRSFSKWPRTKSTFCGVDARGVEEPGWERYLSGKEGHAGMSVRSPCFQDHGSWQRTALIVWDILVVSMVESPMTLGIRVRNG